MRLSDSPMAPGTRVAARIEYHGGHYHGWQAQPHLSVPTVQEALEAALQEIAGESVRTTCAGRTDTGVHGFAQVVHFDDPVGRSLKAWVMGTNRHLPADIRVHWAQEVGEAFHARFSATARRYRYIICNTSTRPALLHSLVTWYRHALDVELMNDAAETLLGEHDFSAFGRRAVRHPHPIDVSRPALLPDKVTMSSSTSPLTLFCTTWCAILSAHYWPWVPSRHQSSGLRWC